MEYDEGEQPNYLLGGFSFWTFDGGIWELGYDGADTHVHLHIHSERLKRSAVHYTFHVWRCSSANPSAAGQEIRYLFFWYWRTRRGLWEISKSALKTTAGVHATGPVISFLLCSKFGQRRPGVSMFQEEYHMMLSELRYVSSSTSTSTMGEHIEEVNICQELGPSTFRSSARQFRKTCRLVIIATARAEEVPFPGERDSSDRHLSRIPQQVGICLAPKHVFFCLSISNSLLNSVDIFYFCQKHWKHSSNKLVEDLTIFTILKKPVSNM